MEYRISFEVKYDNKIVKFKKYRTVKTLGEAWDIAWEIAKEYNSKHKGECKPVNVHRH
jgi:hypothetical protein